jgi:hypothetical protein
MTEQQVLKEALENQRKQSLAEVLPLACETLISTNDYRTFSVAGNVLDKTWVRMSPILQYRRFEKVIYNIFWPRIGSIENIEKQLKKPYEDGIFWDSMCWIRSLQRIRVFNPKLYNYFDEIGHLSNAELAKLPRELKGRAIEIKNHKLTPSQNFQSTLDSFLTADAMMELSYTCYTIESASILMNAIVMDDGSIERKDGVACINNLLSTNRSKRVRKYALHRLLSERFSFNKKDYLSFIESAAKGVESESELELIKSMAKPFTAEHPEIKEALKEARTNLAIEKFQRESIRKSPIVKDVMRQYGHRR